jgi:signal transduction histidine kinase/ligand-binding sensor domain-containing protein
MGLPTRVRGKEEQLTSVGAVSKDFLIQNWQTDEGLPRSTIFSIAQDHQGYLWMGTPEGLIRFDGVRFSAFEGGALPTMARGFVQQLFPDDSGALWIATRGSGLLRYREGSIAPVGSKDLPANVAVDSIAQGGDRHVWVTRGDGVVGRVEKSGAFVRTARLVAKGPMLFKLTTDRDGGLWFFKQDTYGRLVNGQPTNRTTYAESVITLAPSRKGGLWVSTGFDLRRLKSGQVSTEETLVALPSGPYGVNAMYEDRSGTLWLGMLHEGLLRLKDGRLEKVEGINHTVWSILDDAEGNLWVGTEGAGLFKIRPRVFRLISTEDGLPTSAVVSVCDDWVAPKGGGLGKVLPSGWVQMIAGFEQNSVSSVLEDGAGGVWVGTTGGRLMHQTGGEQRSSVRLWQTGPQVRVLHRDHKRNLWVGGFPSGLFMFSAGEDRRWNDLSWRGFSNTWVTAIAEDTAGVIWIGTGAGELCRCEGEDFRRYGTEKGFSGFPLAALLPGSSDTLWVGTLGGGLGRFQNGKVQFLGERADLDDNVITQLIEDKAGWMWVGSSRGISRVLAAELQAVFEGRKPKANAVHFGPADGLANLECVAEHQPSVWMTPAGQLRFATSRGVVAFDPSAIPRNHRPPPLNLESVLVDGVAVAARPECKLPSNFKKIEFRYTAMSFTAPKKVRFRRHLSRFDEDWVEDGISRSASYPRLPPGQYEFQFTACNNDGVWNDEPIRFAFEVTPAFWQTTWFRVAAIIIFAGLVGGAVLAAARVRMRRKLARLEQAHALERERARISRDLHDDLGARLTQMALLTDLAADDPTAPEQLKFQIKDVAAQARTAVQSLDETVWMVNPQKDTLAHVIEYVARYAEQFFQSMPIHCRLEICRQPPKCMMPGRLRRDIFMLVKEALTNVLKHSQASEVWLHIAVREPLMRITVKDNGRGFEVSSPNARHGLDNMRRRAEGAGIKVSVHSQIGRGTRLALRIKLPLSGTGRRPSFARARV